MTCPRCEDQNIISPLFLEETKAAFSQLTVELIIFFKKHKIKNEEMPVLAEVARIIRIIESL